MKSEVIRKISKYTGWISLTISVILSILFYLGLKDMNKVIANLDLMLIWTLIIVILVFGTAFIAAPIISILTNPKNIVKAGISIGVFVVVFLIALIFAKADTSSVLVNYKIPDLAQKVKLTDIGLISFYIFSGIIILTIILSEIKSLLKL